MIVNAKGKKSSKRKRSGKSGPDRPETPMEPSSDEELSDVKEVKDQAPLVIASSSSSNIQDVCLPEAGSSGFDGDSVVTTKFLIFIDSLLSDKPPKWFATRPATNTDDPLKTKMVFENLFDKLRLMQLNRTLAIADGLIYKMSAPYRHMKFWKSTRHTFKELTRAQQYNIAELLQSISAKLISSNFQYNISDQTLNYVAALLIATTERLCRTCRLAIAAAAHCLAHIDLGHLTGHNILLLSVLSDAYNGSLRQVKILLDGYESVKSMLNLDDRFPATLRSLQTVEDLLKISEKRWQSMGINEGIWNQRKMITDLLRMNERDLARAFVSNVKLEQRQSAVHANVDFESVPVERGECLEESRDLDEIEEDEEQSNWMIEREPEPVDDLTDDDQEVNEANRNKTIPDIVDSEQEGDLLTDEQPQTSGSFKEEMQTVSQEKLKKKKKLKNKNLTPLENPECMQKSERKKLKLLEKKRKRELENFTAEQGGSSLPDSMGISAVSKKKLKKRTIAQSGLLENPIADSMKRLKIRKKKKSSDVNEGKPQTEPGMKRKIENSQQPEAETSEKMARHYLLANEKDEAINSVGRSRRRRRRKK